MGGGRQGGIADGLCGGFLSWSQKIVTMDGDYLIPKGSDLTVFERVLGCWMGAAH